MSSESHGEDPISEVFAHVAAAYGPGTARLMNLLAESIARWIQMTSDWDSAVGTCVLPQGSGTPRHRPSAAQHAPELQPHVAGPAAGQVAAGGTPAGVDTVYVVWPTSMR